MLHQPYPVLAKFTQSSVIALRIFVSASEGIALINSSLPIGKRYCNSSAWATPERKNLFSK